MKKVDSQTYLLEHSAAKVELYGTYLATYLNILSRVPSVKRILLFDLLCGEGCYGNGYEGSPLIAINKIKEHYDSNGQTSPNIGVWFNDNGMSQIEPNCRKIDRVRYFIERKFGPWSSFCPKGSHPV